MRRFAASTIVLILAAMSFAQLAQPSTEPTTRNANIAGDLRLLEVGDGATRRTLRVWLPPNYEASGSQRFPVLYMQDGQNLFDPATAAFGTEWQVDETLTRLIGERAIPPIIVVGIDNTPARIDEYTVEQDEGRGGKGEAYERFLIGQVKPMIDDRFRTLPGRSTTYIGGASLGGLISLDAARRFPDVFGGVLAVSPSLWWADEALTKAYETDSPVKPFRVVITMGRREGRSEAGRARYILQSERLHKRLAAIDPTASLQIDDAGEHNEASWASQFPAAIRALLTP